MVLPGFEKDVLDPAASSALVGKALKNELVQHPDLRDALIPLAADYRKARLNEILGLAADPRLSMTYKQETDRAWDKVESSLEGKIPENRIESFLRAMHSHTDGAITSAMMKQMEIAYPSEIGSMLQSLAEGNASLNHKSADLLRELRSYQKNEIISRLGLSRNSIDSYARENVVNLLGTFGISPNRQDSPFRQIFDTADKEVENFLQSLGVPPRNAAVRQK